jgi:hypothetical protein
VVVSFGIELVVDVFVVLLIGKSSLLFRRIGREVEARIATPTTEVIDAAGSTLRLSR